jgi:hypothetical protein
MQNRPPRILPGSNLKTASTDLWGMDEMKAVRRWLIYRGLVKDLADLPAGSLAELGTLRTQIGDFAWHAAGLEAKSKNFRSEATGAANASSPGGRLRRFVAR